ncbi:MAG: flagellar hook-associated protein 3 FlgL [Pseudohongiellaceae bacterium]|jgi:flagellar hook-associated protein 3 FlgL
MRISTQQLFNRGIEQIQDVTAQQQKTQLQLSTGKKVLTPADDPVASTRILELNQELARNDQFQRNIDLVDGRLELQDDMLGSIGNAVQRIRELSVKAGNGILNGTDLNSIAVEAEVILDQLAGLLNSQDASGEYLFSGFQGGSEPFQKNISGAYTYQGDEGRRFVQVGPSVSIASTENGKEIFQNVDVNQNTFYTLAGTRNQSEPAAQITTGQVIDQEIYDDFYPEDLTITFNTPSDYSITEASTGRVVVANQPYVSNEPISANGIQFEISGAPVAGDSFFVQSSEKQGILTTVEKFVYGLQHFNTTDAGRATFANVIDSSIANLDNAQTSILEARSQVGARLNTIETTKEQLLDVEILTKEILTKIESIDVAEAISLLSIQKTTLEAAYSSYAQVTSLSLFDRL